MRKSKNDLNIQFKGKKDDLVIKLNGKIIYPLIEEKSTKEISPAKLNTQLRASVAAVFSGGVNRIIPLRQTWKRWPVKSRVPYRNILAANIKRCKAEHPTIENMVCPDSGVYLPQINTRINKSGIAIDIDPFKKDIVLGEKEDALTIAGLLSLYSPREKEADLYKIYPLTMPILEFDPLEKIKVIIPFNEESLNIISKYERCILYFTLLFGEREGMTRRWSRQHVDKYALNNDINGKFIRGEQEEWKKK
jgi:hypothetical protein